jgi:hypothetical protein
MAIQAEDRSQNSEEDDIELKKFIIPEDGSRESRGVYDEWAHRQAVFFHGTLNKQGTKLNAKARLRQGSGEAQQAQRDKVN